jgi:hypothetical protein
MSDFSISQFFGSSGTIFVGIGSAVLMATLTLGSLKADVVNLKDTQAMNFQIIQTQLNDLKQQINGLHK